ncbi:MAG: hypothetical protein M1366_05505 [Patescibacteria group bacterium]|nr:hypothetical protein [Patescibacteria group bacterium]
MWKSLLTIILFFTLGVFTVLTVRYFQVKKIKEKPFIPRTLDITLTPPAASRQGTIIEISGDVKLQPFDKDSFSAASTSAKIVLGDAILTGYQSSALVSFTNYADLKVGAETELVFSNLTPNQFLFWQKSGTVSYKASGGEKLAVRSLNSLVSLSGEAKITTDIYSGTVSTTDLQGSAVIGYEDKDNNTKVYNLSQDKKAVYDNSSKTVEIR